jgi:TonB family protein
MKSSLAACALALTPLAFAACAGEPPAVAEPVLLPAASPFRYPVAQWDQHVEGETMLLLHITEDGQVDSTQIQTSSGVGALDTAALTGARELRFTPGKRGERYVGMWTKLPVRFAIDSAAAAAADAAKADSAMTRAAPGDSTHE